MEKPTMIRTVLVLAALGGGSAAVFGLFATACFGEAAVGGAATVDYEKFLARHDLVWNRMPTVWGQAPFLGNGMLGSMIYQSGPQSLRFDVGRADYYGHRDGFGWITRSRMPIGYFTLETSAPIQAFEGRLDLWNAEFTGLITTAQGTVKLKALVHSQRMVMIFEIETSGSERSCRFVWHPEEAVPPARAHALQELAKNPTTKDPWIKRWSVPYDPNPPFQSAVDQGVELCHQPLLEGGGTTTAWQEVAAKDGRRTIYVSVAHAYPKDTTRTEAVEAVRAALAATPEELIKTHRQWWHEYYPASFISLPDAYWEGFYWIQMYKVASATRADRALIDCLGPWYQQTDWPMAWFNLNVQLTYWCVADSNRLDLGESLAGRFDRHRDNLIANMPARFGGDCAGFYTTVPPDLYSPWEMQSLGDLPWAMHNYWMLVRRSMDEQRMKKQFFPLLKLSINTYLKVLKEGADGRLHLPPSFSPEIGYVPDANYNLALLRWGCRTLVELCRRLKIDDPLLPKWKETLERLVDYPTDANGFMIGRDFPLALGHRHYSHLLMIYPLYLVNVEQPGGRELIEKSLRHWIGYKDGKCIYTWAGASSIASALNDGNLALEYLNRIRLDDRLTCTTMQNEGGNPVMESPLATAQCIHDMLLQSWGNFENRRMPIPESRLREKSKSLDENEEPALQNLKPGEGGYVSTIRVFPAVPDAWREVCFSDLRVEGAFLVSAARKGGKTQWIRVKSLAGELCRIKTDMAEPTPKESSRRVLKTVEPGVYELNLKEGDEAVLVPKGSEGTVAVVAPVEPFGGGMNMFGLNPHQAK
jgi:hypothetical protein